MPEITAPKTVPTGIIMEPGINGTEYYERGITLRKAGLFKQAIEELEQASRDRTYAIKAYAQIGLCYKSSGRHEEAVGSGMASTARGSLSLWTPTSRALASGAAGARTRASCGGSGPPG